MIKKITNKETLEKLSLILAKKTELEQEIVNKVLEENEKLEGINALIEVYKEELSKEFPEGFVEDAFVINGNYNFLKKIKNKIDTTEFIKILNVSTSELGDKGKEIFESGQKWGITIKELTNRTEFIKGVKAKSVEIGLDKKVIAELIKAVEDKTSEKTIVYEIKGN